MRKSKKITKNIENLFTSIVYGTYKQYIAATKQTTITKSNSNKQTTNSNEASNKKQ